jgi:hypothetical protein
MAASPIPLVDFSGSLKQIEFATLMPVQKKAIEYAFPYFFSSNELSNQDRQALDILRSKWCAPEVESRRYRFAGSDDLPRGSYWTLCRQDAKDDGGTLLNELVAYYKPRQSGVVLIFDLYHPNSIARLARFDIEADQSTALTLLFVGTPLAPSPFIAWLARHGLWDLAWGTQAERQVIYPVSVPYSTLDMTIPNTLDLRTPQAEHWLVEAVNRDEFGFRLTAERGRFGDFVELLPHLLGPETGGNRLTSAVGRHLRRNGTKALVFPSARSNCCVAYEAGRCFEFYGWNLVDYRSAPDIRDTIFVDVTDTDLPLPMRDPSKAADLPSPPSLGNWRINGVEEVTLRVVDEAIKEILSGVNNLAEICAAGQD